MSHAQPLPDDLERENENKNENQTESQSSEVPAAAQPKSSAPVAAKPATSGARKGGLGLLAALLFVGLIVCGLALIEQTRIVSSLEAEVAVLEGEVATSRAALGLYESRLESVKGEVANLAYGVAGLIELLNQDVTAEAEASPGETAEEVF